MVHCIYWGVTGSNLQNYFFLSLKIDYVLANSADPYEMPLYVAFYLVFLLFVNVPV